MEIAKQQKMEISFKEKKVSDIRENSKFKNVREKITKKQITISKYFKDMIFDEILKYFELSWRRKLCLT